MDGAACEANITYGVTHKLAQKLRAAGIIVIETRPTPNAVVESRFDARLDAGAEQKMLHLSIHVDDNPTRSMKGVVAYYSKYTYDDSRSRDFARALGGGQTLPHDTDLLDPFVLGNVPAALVEIGNVRDSNECMTLCSEEGQEEMADKLYRSIIAYYKNLRAELPHLPALGTPATDSLPNKIAMPVRDTSKRVATFR
jgi:N-acetylmuramoyl-L-alanine amidase